MRFDSKMPMVEDVCRLQWLDVRTCPIVSVALVRVHLPWWQQLIHRFHVWQRNECYLQIIITMSMHRADNVIYRNKCKINSKIEKEPFCFYCDQMRILLGSSNEPELNICTFVLHTQVLWWSCLDIIALKVEIMIKIDRDHTIQKWT